MSRSGTQWLTGTSLDRLVDSSIFTRDISCRANENNGRNGADLGTTSSGLEPVLRKYVSFVTMMSCPLTRRGL